MALLVVTPTLGQSPFLASALASVHRARVPIRHVIVAPGAAESKVRGLCPDCTFVADDVPGGVYSALNRAIESIADWEWFAYLNDDDLLSDQFARLAEGCLRAPDSVDIGYGDIRLVDREGGNLGLFPVERQPAKFAALLRQGIVPFAQQGSVTNRRVFGRLGGYDLRFRLAGEVELLSRCVREGFRFRYFPLEAACWRIHANQLSMDRVGQRRELTEIGAGVGQGLSAGALTRARLAYRLRNAGRYMERMLVARALRVDTLFDREAAREPARPRPA